MADTFTLIASSTLASAQAEITFSSIPATFTDLQLFYSIRSAGSGAVNYPALKINGVTTNQTMKVLLGTGSSTSSSSPTLIEWWVPASTATASTFSNDSFYFPNYAGSNNKSISKDTVTENNATAAYAELGAALWSSSAAITSLTVYIQGGANLAQYSTAYLYGLKSS
jgi:hypothetical protein